ncbi:hypothetical protein, partial [Pseudomonas aeruginosa]|uniref:hypothetical protein n=1 Tax=Pseudomonas aeruginosa TaxID=287 RepID=UPI001A7EC45A
FFNRIGRLLPVATGSFRSTSAGRHYGVYWSSRMQSGGQYECNCLVSWNAIRWSSQCNFAEGIEAPDNSTYWRWPVFRLWEGIQVK